MTSIEAGVERWADGLLDASLRLRVRIPHSDLMRGDVTVRNHPDVAEIIVSIADEICAMCEGRSRWETSRSLIWDIVVPAAYGGTTDARGVVQPPPEFVQEQIATLVSCPTGSVLEIPVLEMAMRDRLEFGGVTFTELVASTLKDDPVAGWIYRVFDGRVTALATLRVRGDEDTTYRNVLSRVDEVLRVLSGMSWPTLAATDFLQRWPFGGQGDPVLPSAVGGGLDPGMTPFRVAGRTNFSGSFGGIHSVGPRPVFPDDLEDTWSRSVLIRLSRAYAEPAQATEVEGRLLNCLRWLGEALKPDIASARTIKLAAALEGLVGLRASGSRGDSLAARKRLAWLAQTGARDRRVLKQSLEGLYNTRDAVMHEGSLVVREPHLTYGQAMFDGCLTVSQHLECCSTFEALCNHCGI